MTTPPRRPPRAPRTDIEGAPLDAIVGRARLLVWVAVVLSPLGVATGQASAAGNPVVLDYAAGPDCPDQAAFKAIVIARLRFDPFGENARDHVAVRIAQPDAPLEGRIEWRDAAGRWVGEQTFPLVGTDCVRLARTIGFALAVQIQFRANAAPSSAAGEGAPPTGSPSRPSAADSVGGTPDTNAPGNGDLATPRASGDWAAEPETVPDLGASRSRGAAQRPEVSRDDITLSSRSDEGEQSRRPSQSWARPALTLGAAPAVAVGLSSGPMLLGRLFTGLVWPYVSVELSGSLSQRSIMRRADGAGVSQRQWTAGAAICGVLRRWNACLIIDGGEISMAGVDIKHPATAALPLLQAGVRAAFVQPAGARLFLVASVDGLVNVTRWVATLDQIPVWTAPRFAAVAALGCGVRLW